MISYERHDLTLDFYVTSCKFGLHRRTKICRHHISHCDGTTTGFLDKTFSDERSLVFFFFFHWQKNLYFSITHAFFGNCS